MKKLLKFQWLFLFTALISFSCSDKDDVITGQTTVNSEIEIQDFIWKSMNYWYLWQENVNDLADNRFSSDEAYKNFLSSYSDPKDLFNHLKYTQEDDFSWYIEDVDAQLNQFRGISESFGVNIKPVILKLDNDGNAVIYVAYVVPNSPADEAGVKRGDLIYKVNGSVLTTTNYSETNELISPTKPSITFGIGKLQDGTFKPNPNEITLAAKQLNENPVYYHSVIEENGKQIGYLVYNSFTKTYNKELNDVFTEFKSKGINELILDFRYNSGGSVLTSTFLASMIDGSQPEKSPFAELRYNNKRNSTRGFVYPFFDTGAVFDKNTGEYIEGQEFKISRLTTLNRLYVITSSQTASASELIINGLRPFMDVTIVGTKTTGKNDASLTLVDAPADSQNEAYLNINKRNPNHNVGLQPIVSKTFNSVGKNDYDDGFEPNIEIDEAKYAGNILPFGDTNEIMLRTALNAISGTSSKNNLSRLELETFSTVGKLKEKRFSKEMYITPGDLKALLK